MLALASCRQGQRITGQLVCWDELRTYGACYKSFLFATAVAPLARAVSSFPQTWAKVARTLVQGVQPVGLLLWIPPAVLGLLDLVGVGQGLGGARKPVSSRAPVPFAGTLKATLTFLIIVFHTLAGRPHHHELMSTLTLCVDCFFILTGYLSVVGLRLRTCAKAEGLPTRARCAAADAAAAVLRRIARTAPTFVLLSILDPGGYLTHLGWGHRGWGLIWVGPPWPWALELLCLIVLRSVLVPFALLGDVAGLAVAVALLAACVESRLRLGYEGLSDKFYGAIIAHRLPEILLAAVLARLLGRTALPRALGLGRPFITAALAWAARGAAAICVAASVAFQLSWRDIAGDRAFWYLHPFFLKVPLVCGCVLLLEVSRRTAIASGRAVRQRSLVLATLEDNSLQLLAVHVPVYIFLNDNFPSAADTPEGKVFEDWFFYLPMVLLWSAVASACVAWAQAPYEHAMNSFVGAVHRLASNASPGGGASGEAAEAAILLSQIAALFLVLLAFLCALASWRKLGYLADAELL